MFTPSTFMAYASSGATVAFASSSEKRSGLRIIAAASRIPFPGHVFKTQSNRCQYNLAHTQQQSKRQLVSSVAHLTAKAESLKS